MTASEPVQQPQSRLMHAEENKAARFRTPTRASASFRSRGRVACAVAIAGLLTLSACGSGDDREPSATTSARPTTTTVKVTTTAPTTARETKDRDREADDQTEEAKEAQSQRRGAREGSDVDDTEVHKQVVRVPGHANAHPEEGHGHDPAEQSPDEPDDPAEAEAPEAPTPNPVEAQDTAANETYYASCSEAPGPLLPHQAGYRSGLDSDGDGIACEPDENTIDDAPAAPSGGYDSCQAAREAGATPLREGDPGYNRQLDKDGDGVACE